MKGIGKKGQAVGKYAPDDFRRHHDKGQHDDHPETRSLRGPMPVVMCTVSFMEMGLFLFPGMMFVFKHD